MKSKPVYANLELDPTAKRHLFFTQGRGTDAVRCALDAAPSAEADVLPLDAPAPLQLAVYSALERAGMDTAFYVTGPEAFLWRVTGLLRDAGIEERRIQRELVGSLARRVYCVHCCIINQNVTTTIYHCDGCGIALTVRDHFSRPLSAYMGVIVDAENPGDVPEPEVLYT
jgi:hypothetical protein